MMIEHRSLKALSVLFLFAWIEGRYTEWGSD